MSDTGFGFGMDGGGGTIAQSNAIVLDLGLDTTDGAYGDRFMVGTHKFAVNGPIDVSFTTDGEANLAIPLRIIESNVDGATGQIGIDNMVIPGKDRKANDPETWKKMMKFTRMRLEGITGRQWREDNLQLDIEKDFYGCIFLATVTHKETKARDGSGRTFTNANLGSYVNVQSTQSSGSSGMGFDQPAANPAHDEPF